MFVVHVTYTALNTVQYLPRHHPHIIYVHQALRNADLGQQVGPA